MQSFTTSKLVTFSNGSIELVEEDDIFVQSLSYEMCSIFTDEAERRDRFHELAGRVFRNKRGTDAVLCLQRVTSKYLC